MSAVFLDLDGTLLDSKPGIEGSLRHAFRTAGYDHHAEEDLTWMIGPPFQDSFERLGIDDPDPILNAYRDHYQSSGMYEAQKYEGIEEMIGALAAAGNRLYLATAKPHAYARKITAHFGLAPSFTAEFGPELDGTRGWKGDLLAHALEVTGERAEASVMVGDRHHDFAAGDQVGMATIAVTWGYGTPEEWAGAGQIAQTPADVSASVRALGFPR